MLKEFLINLFNNNQGKVICSILGFIIALLMLTIGFFRTLLLLLFIGFGYFIGDKLDKNENLLDILERILPSSWNRKI